MDNTNTTEQAPVLTVEQFLAKYPDYYRYEDIPNGLEVNCKKRNEYPTEEELADLAAMGYYNVYAEVVGTTKDQTTCCCGYATFGVR